MKINILKTVASLTVIALVFSCGSSSTTSSQVSSSSSSGTSTVLSSGTIGLSSGATSINYGTLTDLRDGQTYTTVVIGTQTWMAQNLNYTPATPPDSSWCNQNLASNCALYGRLYNHATALTVCPNGWSLPDAANWDTLVSFVGKDSAAIKLMSTTGWLNGLTASNAYGFSAMPGGAYGKSKFLNSKAVGYWWVSTLSDTTAYYQYIEDDQLGVFSFSDGIPASGFSVRCIMSGK